MRKSSSKSIIRSPRGHYLITNSWLTEAPLRLFMNNLDPEVTEKSNDPHDEEVSSVFNWSYYKKIIEVLKRLKIDETLLIQSGRPVGVFKTSHYSPRLLMVHQDDNLKVPSKQNQKKSYKGLVLHSQLAESNWTYIGIQGIIQGTYETFMAVARKHFNGNLRKRWILTTGLGKMGRAQPLAAVMAGASILVVENDIKQINKQFSLGNVNQVAKSLDEALRLINHHIKSDKPISVALLGNAAEVYPLLIEQNVKPDIVTDQTSAHDPLWGYYPKDWKLAYTSKLRKKDPDQVQEAAKFSMALQVQAMLEFQKKDVVVFEYGNNIRKMAYDTGIKDAFLIPDFISQYLHPLFCEGVGPFRWIALSGDPEDIFQTEEEIIKRLPNNKALKIWFEQARKNIPFQGLPARICWLGLGERVIVGQAFNQLVRDEKVKAPIVISGEHLDVGTDSDTNQSMGGRYSAKETQDWSLLHAFLSCASGATWVSLNQGCTGTQRLQHASFALVCDGTFETDEKIERVLTNDPACGIMQQADAGHALAKACSTKYKLDLPMLESEMETETE